MERPAPSMPQDRVAALVHQMLPTGFLLHHGRLGPLQTHFNARASTQILTGKVAWATAASSYLLAGRHPRWDILGILRIRITAKLVLAMTSLGLLVPVGPASGRHRDARCLSTLAGTC